VPKSHFVFIFPEATPLTKIKEADQQGPAEGENYFRGCRISIATLIGRNQIPTGDENSN
jgi:hypothetical protein